MEPARTTIDLGEGLSTLICRVAGDAFDEAEFTIVNGTMEFVQEMVQVGEEDGWAINEPAGPVSVVIRGEVE